MCVELSPYDNSCASSKICPDSGTTIRISIGVRKGLMVMMAMHLCLEVKDLA